MSGRMAAVVYLGLCNGGGGGRNILDTDNLSLLLTHISILSIHRRKSKMRTINIK